MSVFGCLCTTDTVEDSRFGYRGSCQTPVIGNGICSDLDPAGEGIILFTQMERGNAYHQFAPFIIGNRLLHNLLPLSTSRKTVRL